ncbi:MAG: di-trans,poly-cis-decaprenylcistransferase [Planctomycetes bacterium]|nr:di-trans,poly-cis-decaprenylcistransferase [Planctomycetota bacterium]
MSSSTVQRAVIPRHIGIIMDGNGRWALERGRPRIVGHRVGASTVRRITEAAARLGVNQLTLFAFSTENWKRPAGETQFLMRLFLRFLSSDERVLIERGIRLHAIGRLHELPDEVRRELLRVMESTSRGDRFTLCLAVNYGARSEIVDACRALAGRAIAGSVQPSDIDEALFEGALYQPDMPPLDLVIRTGGDMRLSNFLLWQAAYAELWITPDCWPDFSEEHLMRAIDAFATRERRFGALLGSREFASPG